MITWDDNSYFGYIKHRGHDQVLLDWLRRCSAHTTLSTFDRIRQNLVLDNGLENKSCLRFIKVVEYQTQACNSAVKPVQKCLRLVLLTNIFNKFVIFQILLAVFNAIHWHNDAYDTVVRFYEYKLWPNYRKSPSVTLPENNLFTFQRVARRS